MQPPEPVTDPPLHVLRSAASAASNSDPSTARRFWGLLWCEWYAHGKLLLFFLGAWVLMLWSLSLYANPAWMLLFGAGFALVAGPIYGGSDTLEACEEWSLALPPTRGERYLARLVIGGGALLFFSGIDLIALGLDLPQILAKLYVDSGLIRPLPVFKSGLLFGLVVAAPLAVFAFSFVLATLTHSRGLVLSAPFWAVLTVMAALRAGFWYEDIVWETLNGFVACPLMVLLAALVLWVGYQGYQRKEVGHHSAPLVLPPHWWLWLLLSLAGAVLALTLIASLAGHYPRLFRGAG